MGLQKLVSFVWQHPLNADGRLPAIGRLLRWQIACRLLPGLVALPFIEDTQLFAKRGMTGATGNWYCGLHEADEMGFILHFLRPGDLFLDAGANIGSYTVMAAGAVGARVISVEPIPSTFLCLQMNTVLNGLSDRVELHCLGLSNQRAELRFTADQDTVNHVMVEGESGCGVSVPVVCMDELLAGSVPKVVKIDVEGHEKSVLLGAQRTLSNQGVEVVIMEVNGSGGRYGVNDSDLLDGMRAYGFMPYGYDPFARRLREWVPSNANAIFVRDRNIVGSRVRQSKRYRLINGTI